MPVRRTSSALRLAASVFGTLCALLALPAIAATYTFRSDTYSWETAANTVGWDRTCTDHPSDDDKATITFSGGFRFSFAGSAYTSVRVLSNGMLQFGTDTGVFRAFSNGTLPAGSAPSYGGCVAGAMTNVMMPYWDDLDPSRGGSVTWQQKGSAPNRYVVVSWNNVYQYSTTTPYTFQVILYENGEFKYQYGNANATGASATIGVQVNSSDYTQYSYNSSYNVNGTALRWFQASGSPSRLAEYRMDEQSWNGTLGEVGDSSGNGYHGVRVGSAAATTASGYVCRAFDVALNASTTVTAVDTALDVDSAIGSTGSVSFWYRGNSAWTSMADGQLFDATRNTSRSFHLVRRSNGSLRFAVSDSSGNTLSASSANQSFASGTWVHIATTWRLASGSNQSVLRIYVNGVLAATASGTTTGALDPSLGTLFVGDNRANITSNNATVNSADGRIDELRVYNYEVSTVELATDMATTRSCASPLHHVELQHGSGTGLTCTPSTVTVVACQDSACSTRYTGGLTGTVTATGSGMTVNWPGGSGFSIASGSSSTTLQLQLTTAGSVVLGTTALSASASNATTCNFGSPACTYSAADAGFQFDVPHHVAETSQSITVAAVKKSDTSTACVPAFASTTKAVTFKCSYANPASGTLPVRLGGNALNSGNNAAAACDAGGRAVNLAFNAGGVASTTVQYADVGQITLNASYSGSGNEAGLAMTGSDSFIAAPSTFGFSGITAAPIKAGTTFAATVTARNSAGGTTPNFGRESTAEGVNVTFTRRAPTGAGASDGSFSGSVGGFSGGSASSANLVWSEVGSGDLSATLASGSYLGSGLGASGSTGTAGAVGRFIPHHFDVAVTPACGAFSYAGQPFSVTVTAKNGLTLPGTTLNYDGSAATSPAHAKAVTLTDQPTLGVGSLSSASIAASAFTAGVASATPSYTFTTKTTAPQTLALRALDTDAVSSAGFAEGSTALRSGRLRLASAYGGEKAALAMPVHAEYWSGSAWLTHSADSCTSVPAAAVALSNRRNHQGSSAGSWSNTTAAITLVGGLGTLTLGAPVPTASGIVDVALNLGSTGTDQSCLGTHPVTTGAARAWLRAANGSCAASTDRDPSARASFGIHSPETQRTIHARELY